MRILVSAISRILDLVGIMALVVTAMLLAGSFWFVDRLIQGILLNGVFPWLGSAVALFTAARLIDLARFGLSREGRRRDVTPVDGPPPATARSGLRVVGRSDAEGRSPEMNDAA